MNVSWLKEKLREKMKAWVFSLVAVTGHSVNLIE